jgi:hypothetical protein
MKGHYRVLASLLFVSTMAWAPVYGQEILSNTKPLRTEFTNASKFDVKFASISDGFIKIYASGHITSQGKDHRLVLRINGDTGNYQSYVLMSGHASTGEWDNSGIYLGRTGWAQDADFSTEVTIAANSKSQKIDVSALTTFALGNNLILGYESHGFYVSTQPVTGAIVQFTDNAVASGFAHAYVY